MNEHVWVITDEGIEHCEIVCVCGSEAIAIEEFEKLRKKLLKERIRMDKKFKKDNADHFEVLEKTTFYKQLDHLFEHPRCKRYKTRT